MLRRFDRLNVTVQGLDDELRGWAEVDGVTVRIPGALPGQQVRVRIEGVSRHRPEAFASWHGEPERPPACPHAWPLAGKCGGCPGLHIDYADQLQAKGEALARALAPLELERTPGVRPSPKTEGWRNRTNHVVRRPRKGRPRLGSRAPRTGDFAPMDGCLAVRSPIAGLADRIAGFLKPAQGLRYVSLRANRTGQALVELIAYDLGAPWVPDLVAGIAALSAVVGVAGSENDQPGNAIRVEPARALAGEATLTERFGEVPAHVTADAFLQLNTEVAEAMYEVVADWAAGSGASRLVDLYCGVGPLGLAATRAAGPDAELIGVEVHAGSQALAERAAEDIGVNARFVTADLSAGPVQGLVDAGFITVNPPRRGLDEAVRAALAELSAERALAYMSCNATSFARDAAELTAGGWRLAELSAWDMLPNTPHVELLARFER